MSELPKILFIDAATYFGWAVGRPGEMPTSGSRYFAKGQGASRGAVFWGAMRFTAEMVQEHGTDLVIRIEAPMAASLVQGSTNVSTTEVLMGLPACIAGMAYGMGCFDVDIVRVASIRKHFIGKNMKGAVAKPKVLKKCLDLGWLQLGDSDLTHDRSDALAGWSYACTVVAPKYAQPVDDLFVKAEAKKAGRNF